MLEGPDHETSQYFRVDEDFEIIHEIRKSNSIYPPRLNTRASYESLNDRLSFNFKHKENFLLSSGSMST